MAGRARLRTGLHQAIDLGLNEPPVIFGAKVIRNDLPLRIREAIGQLYEYRYFQTCPLESQLVLLADSPIPEVWVNYLELDREIGTMWRVEEDFVLSDRAARALRL
jgi:hypothetical protein